MRRRGVFGLRHGSLREEGRARRELGRQVWGNGATSEAGVLAQNLETGAGSHGGGVAADAPGRGRPIKDTVQPPLLRHLLLPTCPAP